MEADSVDVKVTDKLEPRQQRVYDWRLEQFTSLGFYDQIAEALAGSTADLTRHGDCIKQVAVLPTYCAY